MNDATKIEIATLENMRLPELQARFAEVVGEKTRAISRPYLIRRIQETLVARETTGATPPVTADQQGSTEPTPPEATATATPTAPATAMDAAFNALPQDGSEPTTVATTATPVANNDDATATPATAPPAAVKLSKLDVPALQARLLELTGRGSGSGDAPYLRWRVRQAEKGKIPVGSRQQRRAAGERGEPRTTQDFRVLPLRLPVTAVARLDEAWARLGLKSRTALIRLALGAYLAGSGDTEVAALFETRG